MPHVFISYAWADGGSLARHLHQRFNALEGWSAWMDDKLHADTVFSHALQNQIDRADLVVVIISPAVNRRDPPSFVQRELAYATQHGVDKPVFAARAADCPLPLIIAGYTYQDFFAGSETDTGFAALVEKIQRSAHHVPALSLRERELAYLRQMARDHGFWGKVYVDTAAEARVRSEPVTSEDPVGDPDIAAYLDELMMAIHPEKGHSPQDDAARDTVESFAALTEALARFERVAIIGDPGSGKTTTLRRFAYDLAEQAARDEHAPLPVFVPLGGYTGGDLNDYLARQFDDLPLHHYLPDRLVVLLDGLNETAHENVASVQAWLDAYPNTRVMLSCRKLDYLERRLDLQRVDVLPLDLKRIRQFMAAYKLSETQCEALFWGLTNDELRAIWAIWRREGRSFDDFWFGEGIASSTTSSQDAYLKRVREDMRQGKYPGLLGLVRNPFLLTLTITIFRQSDAVPRNRGELFNDFVRMLFEQRGKPAARTRPPWIENDIQRTALAALAYRMQREQRGTHVPYAWVRGVVAEAAPAHNPDHLLYLAASAGILETGDEVRFTHQLLQEYFAAHGLGEDIEQGVPASHFWPDRHWWEPTGWEETAILLAGMEGNATDVVRWLTPVQPILAYRCTTESGVPCDEETLAKLYEPAEAARRAPLAVAAWGRILAERGDPRSGVLAPGSIPNIDWCEVPAGPFKMGGDSDAYNSWDGAEFNLPYGFWFARYPVTYAQYEPFVAAGGYQQRRFWTEAGWAGKGEQAEPRYWNDPQWHIANHPVIGVSWYEVYAYTRWLNEQAVTRPAGVPEQYMIRLPRECEWERAARYPDGRLFPWGNEWNPTRLNWNGSGTGRTSAVGIFPDGANPAHGACDLSGNMWEWQLTEWQAPYTSPEKENNAPEGKVGRGLRGGSWGSYTLSSLRAAARNWDYPGVRYDSRGFRVVLSVPVF